jgi:hypothetical protein
MIKKTQKWFQLQMQRLREQGLRQRIKAGIGKTLKMLLLPSFEYIQKRPRIKKTILNMLQFMGLSHRVKRFLAQGSTIQVLPMTPRALEIRQELMHAIKQLEKTG